MGTLIAASGLLGCSAKSNSNNAASVKENNPSQTEILTYQTTYNNKKVTKKALVYLPKNYHKNAKHNVLYLLHGSTEVKDGISQLYQEGNFKQVFDNWDKNTIVVFPTYYPTTKQVTSNYYSDNPLNKRFAKTELVDDLMPAVAKKYKTYAKDGSKAALQKARNHQAFGGFSMGSITTWYVFQYDLPYFKYFIPMAGDSWTVESDGGASAPKETAQVLANAVKENNDLSFEIFAGVGSGDGTSGSMTPQINAMKKLPEFKDKIQYYIVPDGNHDAQTTAKIIRHYNRKIFK
ncbi:alpha/beta hydrolase-fold protein [Lactobacillus sp.]|uniref:alpha/beta hydrolase n=1 Tax=Lactobacillus sp. TaxID=1591 RepID=UPI0019BE24ED|nr:alpha/beta hydrolase-fold protein [Lactobacillus sp.]MBD5430194.1 hypothetical protein [Lactobacillus sp.]